MTNKELEAKSRGAPSRPHAARPTGARLGVLCLGALGIVYGDIGTSPLYALRECFFGTHPVPPTPENVLGVLSLVFWALVIVVALKYHVYVLRFDNRGEGGILALMSLVRPGRRKRSGVRWTLISLGVFGAALLYGDGIITPAISVLSAVEGLEVATPVSRGVVVPATIVILAVLFLFQRRGTGRVGSVFGPVMVLWFATLAVLGIRAILGAPQVLAAVNPAHALDFFARNGERGFLVLGAVFLVATGGEALYADMGHFGEKPIQLDWFLLVGPALVANYFGQGALLIQNPEAAHNPFYRLAPAGMLYPLVGLATAATVIASQAVISGAFSLSLQAVQLGFLPRLDVEHTSASEIGQIYVPAVNAALGAATVALVLGFQTSSRLAAAYGVAVTTTMVITTILAGVVSRERFGWSRPAAVLVTAGFLAADLAFFAANVVKIGHGGWFPLVVAAFVFALMTTWRKGRQILNRKLAEEGVPVARFLGEAAGPRLRRVPGTAVFLTRSADGVPPALVHNWKYNHVLHERIVFLTVLTEEVPYVPPADRSESAQLAPGIHRVVLHYGFMEEPRVPQALAALPKRGLGLDPEETIYFLGKETIFATPKPGMAMWRERLFAFMARNARSATLFFGLPPERVVEMGAQVEI